MEASINPVFGRIAAQSLSEHRTFGGARNPHALECIPVSCAPGALHCIPTTEFLEAST
jgi:hypothetical protein